MGATDQIGNITRAAITARLAEFVVNTRYEDIPDEVLRLAKHSFLDTLGVALGGVPERAPQLLARYVKEQGGTPSATVLAQGFRTNAPNAALVNGTAADILGWSDLSVIQMNHPSVSICPVVWALGEQTKASGKTALLAHVIGVEVADKLGAGIRPAFQLKGWHPVAVLNTFGAAAAAGKLLDLDTGKMGVSAQLAGMGYTGPANVIEGRDGFLQTFGDGASGAGILEHLGNPFEFSAPGITLKKFPACTRSHNGIQAVLNLRKKHRLSPDAVESIECLVTPAVVDYLKFPNPRSKFESKYSMEFCVATALRDGKVVNASFSDEKVTDPELASIMQRVKMSVWPEYAKHGYNPPHAPYGCLVKIKLKSGQAISEQVDKGPWEPETPPSWDDLVDKYRSSSELVLSKAQSDRSIELVHNLEKLADLGELMALVAGNP
ncbi:MAG: MmgE/PrpD family protein [Betaproteobacteria bacterium]|nr:MmgE/PrpD family protein [Betaproteobacteria bacterium]